MPHFRIRPATPDDIRESGALGIRDLYNEVRRAERQAGRSPLAPPHYAGWAKTMDRSDGSSTVLVAENPSGKIIGFALAIHSRRDNTSTLHKLVIAPEAQGSGLGTQLMGKVAEAAKRQGKTSLQVSAEQGEDRASGYYQSLGFTRVASKVTAGGVAVDQLAINPAQWQTGRAR